GVVRATWCGRRDLNPYVFRHGNLNPARLPVPPRPQRAPSPPRRFQDYVPIFSASCTMYANQLTLTCVTAGRRGLYHAESSPRTRKVGRMRLALSGTDGRARRITFCVDRHDVRTPSDVSTPRSGRPGGQLLSAACHRPTAGQWRGSPCPSCLPKYLH